MKQEEFEKFMALLKVAYPSAFNNITRIEITSMIKLYKDSFTKYSYTILEQMVKQLAKKYETLPTLKQMLDEADRIKNHNKFEILNEMRKDGWFKHNYLSEIPLNVQTNNYQIANEWLLNNTTPRWFIQEMQKYGYEEVDPPKVKEPSQVVQQTIQQNPKPQTTQHVIQPAISTPQVKPTSPAQTQPSSSSSTSQTPQPIKLQFLDEDERDKFFDNF